MSIEGLIALVVMLVVGLGGLLLPFLTSRATRIGARKRQLDVSRDELIANYERVLSTLRDLEDDFNSHKMHPADYERERAYWSQYGIKLLNLLDGHTDIDDEPLEDINAEEEVMLDRSVEEAIYNYRVALQSVEKS
jgi:hypothetical protein